MSAAADGQAVFTYGSLMFAPVWERVVSGRYPAAEATLHGFSRRAIRGEAFPALVPGDAAEEVRGLVYSGVSAADLAALDRFEAEGYAYERIRVASELDDGRAMEAWTYLYLLRDRVEPTAWDPVRFARRDLPRFLTTYFRDRSPGRAPSA